MLSNECEPEIVIWLLGPASVTPGESSVTALIDRSIGSSLIVSILKFVVTCVLSAVGALAVTVMASDTDETFSSASARVTVPAMDPVGPWASSVTGRRSNSAQRQRIFMHTPREKKGLTTVGLND